MACSAYRTPSRPDPWTINFPLNVGFVTEDYYQDDEGGFGYVRSAR